MAPSTLVKKEGADRRVQQVFECASKLNKLLHKPELIPGQLIADLETCINKALPFPTPFRLANQATRLDRTGSEIWNAATSLLRQEQESQTPPFMDTHTICVLRVFGFLLIDAAQHASPTPAKDPERCIRTFKLALKACRFTLDSGELELAMKVLERCSDYASAAEEETPVLQLSVSGERRDFLSTWRLLVAEYHLLRMTYAWKTDRYDLAEHFYNKLDSSDLASSASLAEKGADLYHKAAQSLAKSLIWDKTATWCDRALKALDGCNLEDLSYNTPELQLAITATYVQALKGLGNPENLARALQLLDSLDQDHGMGNRITVSLMRFDVLSGFTQPNLEELTRVLMHMIRTAILTGQTFQLYVDEIPQDMRTAADESRLMQTIHKLRLVDLLAALSAMHDLVGVRLLPNFSVDDNVESEEIAWLEKVVITFIHFCTASATEAQDGIVDRVRQLLDAVHQATLRPFSAKAAHAAQTLIWKRSGGDATDGWWCLLTHPAFESAGPLNKAKIGRKTIIARLSRGDTTAARQAFFELPPSVQQESITRYLMFKVALADGDFQLAAECLEQVAKHASKDPSYLYACVLEAQQSDMRSLAVTALRALTDQLPSGSHLPTLLRCTARMMIAELRSPTSLAPHHVEELILLFERAAKNIPTIRNASDAQWRSEVQWWSKNCYNLALRLCTNIHPQHLVRLLAVCTQFIDSYPADGGPLHADNLRHRRLLCHFLSATALIVLGRENRHGDTDRSRECYSLARSEIAFFTKHITERQPPDPQQATDLNARHFELLKFDLEALIYLQLWHTIDPALSAFLSFTGGDTWESLIDLVILLHDTTKSQDFNQRIPQLLQKCINETWKKDKDVVKMSRWLRITFSINLEQEDADFALKIVQQATAVAKKGSDGVTERYPRDELAWLATMAFNRGVDSFARGEREDAEPWVDAALGLAYYAEDNGLLHANLTYKRKAAEERLKMLN